MQAEMTAYLSRNKRRVAATVCYLMCYLLGQPPSRLVHWNSLHVPNQTDSLLGLIEDIVIYLEI